MNEITAYPSSAEIETELKRTVYINRWKAVFRSTVFILITVAAVSVLVATLFLPVLQIYGSSMTPSLSAGDIVVSIKNYNFKQGDIVSFYYNNKILVKRVIAFAGDYVDIDSDGNIYVNDELLNEPYINEKAFGECDIELPYQVPDGRVFVCGDHRSTSVDSRSSTVGCVSEEQVVGRIMFRVWPLKDFGAIN
ncbi:MAG: signal peptidase I [Eubacterium sp.]|nr:signal peptidase I [Eubacterium sp.]